MFYAQSTITVISGGRETERSKHRNNYVLQKQLTTSDYLTARLKHGIVIDHCGIVRSTLQLSSQNKQRRDLYSLPKPEVELKLIKITLTLTTR